MSPRWLQQAVGSCISISTSFPSLLLPGWSASTASSCRGAAPRLGSWKLLPHCYHHFSLAPSCSSGATSAGGELCWGRAAESCIHTATSPRPHSSSPAAAWAQLDLAQPQTSFPSAAARKKRVEGSGDGAGTASSCQAQSQHRCGSGPLASWCQPLN